MDASIEGCRHSFRLVAEVDGLCRYECSCGAQETRTVRRSMYDVIKTSFKKDMEMAKQAASLMSDTWNYIAGDCFIGDSGEIDENMTLWRSDVIELVLDADRMTTNYNGSNDPKDRQIDIAAYAVWAHRYNKAHFMKDIAKVAFPYAKFCY